MVTRSTTDEAGSRHIRLICDRCSDVIGVYEPLVAETPGGSRDTSLAADPALYAGDSRCYHRACYELIDGGADATGSVGGTHGSAASPR